MAKFCGHCGAQLDENARVCGYCGTPVNGVPKKIKGINVENHIQKERNRKIKRTAKIITFLAVLLMIAVVVVKVVTRFTGYNAVIRKTMKAYKSYDIEELVTISSDLYYYGSEDEVDYYFKNVVGNDLDYFETNVGHNYKLSYKIKDTYELSERKLDILREDIKYQYNNFDGNKIEKAVTAEVLISAANKENVETLNKNIVITKENGSWKLLYIE